MFMFAYNHKKTRTGAAYVIMKISPLIVSPYYNFLMTCILEYRGNEIRSLLLLLAYLTLGIIRILK